MNYKLLLYITLSVVFLSGWFSNDMYSSVTNMNKETPFSLTSNELNSPGNWIKESQIKVRSNYITIIIKNATWATFTDTNSMDPVIDETSHAIKLKPKYADDLKVGDIVSYKSNIINGIVIHRIIDIEYDDEGWFAVTKGDNNRYQDSQKVRFDQITGVVIGILY